MNKTKNAHKTRNKSENLTQCKDYFLSATSVNTAGDTDLKGLYNQCTGVYESC